MISSIFLSTCSGGIILPTMFLGNQIEILSWGNRLPYYGSYITLYSYKSQLQGHQQMLNEH